LDQCWTAVTEWVKPRLFFGRHSKDLSLFPLSLFQRTAL
jgi:hypothetical protein